MTNEEIILRLKQNRAAAQFYAAVTARTSEIRNSIKDIEAFDAAITVMESLANGELISRDAAIKALGEEPEIINDTEAEWAAHDQWVSDMVGIKNAPGADLT